MKARITPSFAIVYVKRKPSATTWVGTGVLIGPLEEGADEEAVAEIEALLARGEMDEAARVSTASVADGGVGKEMLVAAAPGTS